jgi:hypothetical protein
LNALIDESRTAGDTGILGSLPYGWMGCSQYGGSTVETPGKL